MSSPMPVPTPLQVLDLRERDDVVLDGRQICIVDDDELFCGQVAALLGQKHLRVVQASSTAALQQLLDRRMPDCILLDYNLIQENGLFVIERLRQCYPHLAPVVMISADETQRTAIRAFRAGVADFVPKRNLRLDDLVVAIRRAIAVRIRDEVRDYEIERLRSNAHFDEQTGLHLKVALTERIALIAETARRLRRHYGLVAFHVTRIIEVQDRFGVMAADRILRAFGRKLRDLVRASDVVGVWSRGTFLCIVDVDATPEALSAFRQRIAEQLVIDVDLAAAHLTLSVVGAEALHPDDGETPEAVIAMLETRLGEELAAHAATAADTDWVRLPAPVQPGNDARERRRAPRQRTLKQGRICLNEMFSTIDCTIRNLSNGGAALRLMGPAAIPEHFRLQIVETGVVRKVRKAWHVSLDLGVEFLPD